VHRQRPGFPDTGAIVDQVPIWFPWAQLNDGSDGVYGMQSNYL
jgi:hypothetical protein